VQPIGIMPKSGNHMKPTVLIADRDEVLLFVYSRLLSRRGYAVKTAVSGVDCYLKIEEGSVEVLILDMDLNWGGGAGVLDLLCQLRPDRLPSAIIVIGDVSVATQLALAERVVMRCLRKPYALGQVLDETLIDIANRKRQQAGSQALHEHADYDLVQPGDHNTLHQEGSPPSTADNLSLRSFPSPLVSGQLGARSF
jgi:DNA-binding NtrC family response regulator